MLPKHWESFDYTIMDNEKFAEFGKANDSWFRTEHAIIRNALDNNRDTINEMIKNEMASLMISGKYNFKFGDEEGMEKLATAARASIKRDVVPKFSELRISCFTKKPRLHESNSSTSIFGFIS